MKIPVYQQQVNMPVLPAYRQSPQADANAFGANVNQAMGNTGKAIGELSEEQNKEWLKDQEQKSTINVLNLSNQMSAEYNTKINELLKRKGQQALSQAATDTTPARPSVTEDFNIFNQQLAEKYQGLCQNPFEQRAFLQYQLKKSQSYSSLIAKHESTEQENSLVGQFNSHMSNMSNDIVTLSLGGKQAESEANWRAQHEEIKYMLTRLGKTEDDIKLQIRNVDNANATSIIKGYLSSEDFKNAGTALETYKDKLDINTYLECKEKVNHYTIKQEETDIAKTCTVWKDGHIDLEASREKLTNYVNSLKKPTSGDISFEKLFMGLAAQESGGNYNSENERTGAHGKYQIMPENWASWAKEAGIPSNSPKTPENQEKVARFKFKQYYDKYGPRGALLCWYGGEGSLSCSDAALNRKQGAGDEPSLNEYVSQVMQKADKQTGVSITAADTGLKYDSAFVDQTMAKITKAKSEHEQALGLKKDAIKNDISAKIESVVSEKGFVEDSYVEALVSQTDLPLEDQKNLLLHFKREDRQLGITQNQATVKEIDAGIQNGTITNFGQVLSYCNSLTRQQREHYDKYFKTYTNKMINLPHKLMSEHMTAVTEAFDAFKLPNESTNDKKFNDLVKQHLKEKVLEQIKSDLAQSKTPTQEDIKRYATEQMTPLVFNKKNINKLTDRMSVAALVPSGTHIERGNVPSKHFGTSEVDRIIDDNTGRQIVYDDMKDTWTFADTGERYTEEHFEYDQSSGAYRKKGLVSRTEV